MPIADALLSHYGSQPDAPASLLADAKLAAAAAAASAASSSDAALGDSAARQAATDLVAGAAAALGRAARAPLVVVTRGAAGAVLWKKAGGESDWEAAGEAWTCAGFVAPPGAGADTVGAGDAFLASLLVQLLADASPAEALQAACRLGAFVAGAQGATPRHDLKLVEALELREPGCGPDGCSTVDFAGNRMEILGR